MEDIKRKEATSEFVVALNVLPSPELFLKMQTPSFVVDLDLLINNLEVLANLRKKYGVRILLAQKAFSAYACYENVMQFLDGTTSSGLYEAKLAKKYASSGEIHVFSPAYKEDELRELFLFAKHLVFNSWYQLKKANDLCEKMLLAGEIREKPSFGLRINPQFSTGQHSLYDPCAKGSRLGVTFDEYVWGVEQGYATLLEGLHFHTLCEQNSTDLLLTWQAFKKKFAPYLAELKWLNLGGGHHFTHPEYDLELLGDIFADIRSLTTATIYLEPGEAIALNTGFLLTEVQDVSRESFDIGQGVGAKDVYNLITDMSPTCHTPDVIEMPYQPYILPLLTKLSKARYEEYKRFNLPFLDKDEEDVEKRFFSASSYGRPALKLGFLEDESSIEDVVNSAYIYRLGGPSCLAGDVMGDYAFFSPLYPRDRLIMGDMSIYSMVKTNTFNGIPLPSIYFMCKNTKPSALIEEKATLVYEGVEGYRLYLWKDFSFDDFAKRL